MTIFLMVLKRLIKEKLSETSQGLLTQSRSYGYNSKLSLDQKEILDRLEEIVTRFDGTGDDKKDLDSIIEAMDQKLKALKDVGEKHSQPRDSGNTVTTMTKISSHAKELFGKLKEYPFPLLNKQYTDTPEGIIYFHSVFYFGEELFTPNEHIDTKIRAAKEQKLGVRLEQLSKLTQANTSFEERKKNALQVLQDLARDNKEAIKSEKPSYAVPGVSFWGVQMTVPSEWFAAGTGRFGQQFNQAIRKIESMTLDCYKPDGDVSAPIAPQPMARSAPVHHSPPLLRVAAAAAFIPESEVVVEPLAGKGEGAKEEEVDHSEGTANSM